MSDAITPVGTGQGPPQGPSAPSASEAPSNAEPPQAVSSPPVLQPEVAQPEPPLPPPENNIPSPAELQEVVDMLNEQVNDLARELHFRVDDATGKRVVTVINSNNGETVRQIPAEEVLAMARSFQQGAGQILLDVVI